VALNGDIIVLALGGNAIVSKTGTFQSQLSTIASVTKDIAALVRRDYRVVITHGNGPQVGNALIRHESARGLISPLPLYACVAETQGLLGFMIQSALASHISNDRVSSLISLAYVSRKDPAFKNPNKPVGPVYASSDLKRMRKQSPHSVFRNIAPGKYRRVVASPDPIRMSGMLAVSALLEVGHTVITAGGGGIPAVRAGGRTDFVDAVVDKDLASERVATSLGASKLVILTDVEGAYLDYAGTKKLLRDVHARNMRRYLRDGEFGEGSMGPKARAAIRFVENTGNPATICRLDKLRQALDGNAGTVVHG
jgi:carbamate kinase